jgi:hypothetical protein
MRGLRARAPTGKRTDGKVPRNRTKNETLIASITLEGAMGASMTIEGATDAKAFEAYGEHFLAPHAREGAGGGARRARGTQDRHSKGTHPKERRRALIPAVLLAGSQSY